MTAQPDTDWSPPFLADDLLPGYPPDTDWSPPFLADDLLPGYPPDVAAWEKANGRRWLTLPPPDLRGIDRIDRPPLTEREAHPRRFRRALACLVVFVGLHVAVARVGGPGALGAFVGIEALAVFVAWLVEMLWVVCAA